MKRHSERLLEYLETAEGQQQLVEWSSGEFTQLVIMAARELARPRGMTTPDATLSLYEHGRSVGANEILDFFAFPRSGADEALKRTQDLQPDYGSRKILKEAGYNEPPGTESTPE